MRTPTTRPRPAIRSQSVDVFYDQLSPYGVWVDEPDVGRVFIPNEDGFVPYTVGHWQYTRSRVRVGLERAVRLGDVALRSLGVFEFLRALGLVAGYRVGSGVGPVAADR